MTSNFWWQDAGGGGYQIGNSLRFRGAEFLGRTPAAAGNRRTFTFSAWVKRANLAATCFLMTQGPNPGSWDAIRFDSNDRLAVRFNNDANVVDTVTLFRDPSAWYHIVVAVDTTQATAANRVKIYINNQQEAIQTAGYPSQNQDLAFSSNVVSRVGNPTWNTSEGLRGYLTETHFVDGQALAATDFGEFNADGVWVPKKVSGLTYGTNGFYLDFSDAADIGADRSGNGNNFTPTGFELTNTTSASYDWMSDTPTTNWCTLNPIDKGSAATLSDGNLIYPKGSTTWNNSGVRGTFAVSSGKWYWEVTKNSTTFYSMYGVATSAANFSEPYTAPNESWTYISDSGNKFGDGSGGAGTSYGATFTNGDVIGVALDMDAGTLVFYKNGTSQGTAFSTLSGETVFPWVHLNVNGDSATCNFGQRDFAYTPPTGFKPLNTSNLSAPTVKDGSEYFNTVLYTGNATERTITGVGFQADFLWNKLRDTGAQDHLLYDTVRGIGSNGNYVRLRSNTATAEEDPATTNQDLTAFTSDGFTIGTHGALNGNNQAYVTWLWKAGGTGSSNTDGSITSTVSANPSAGFSIVSYTGNGSGSATIGHGLGVKPQMVIVKSRSNSSTYWTTYHESISAGTTYCLELNTRAYKDQVNDTFFGSTQTFNSTVFSVGYPGAASNSTNVNTYTYIAYCFAEVEGYSKFGSFTGNGSSDGPFVYCGFRPAWIMLKRATGGEESWQLVDTARRTYNPMTNYMSADTPSTEASSVDFWDQLSNGFKLRNGGVYVNGSGDTYIFAAFAENPFGGSGVSPATAR